MSLASEAEAIIARKGYPKGMVTHREVRRHDAHLFRLIRKDAPSLRFQGVLQDGVLVDVVQITTSQRKQVGNKGTVKADSKPPEPPRAVARVQQKAGASTGEGGPEVVYRRRRAP